MTRLCKHFLRVGVMATLAAPWTSGAIAATPEALFRQLSPSVWIVRADHPGGSTQGSGVVIGAKRLVTACHVVHGATNVVITHSKEQYRVAVARVAADPDPERDMCVLTLAERFDAVPVRLAPIDTVKVGAPVYALGSPLGLELSLSAGLVSSLRTDDKGVVKSIQTSAPTAPGSSGGGLFDADGRLVGITIAIASQSSEAIGFAVPAQALLDVGERHEVAMDDWRALLAKSGVPLRPDGQAVPSGFAAIGDIGSVPAVGPRPQIEAAYRQFLLKAHPRAFVVTSDAQWGAVTSPEALKSVIDQCGTRHAQCAVYAVDDIVVWTGSPI